MKPGPFPQANRTLTKPQGMTDEECGPLPTYTDGTTCISMWRLSWRERIVALLFGKVWLGVLSRLCLDWEIQAGRLREVRLKGLRIARSLRVVYHDDGEPDRSVGEWVRVLRETLAG